MYLKAGSLVDYESAGLSVERYKALVADMVCCDWVCSGSVAAFGGGVL